MGIRLGYSPVKHVRVSTNRRGNVRLGVGARSGAFSATTGVTLSKGSRNRATSAGCAARAHRVSDVTATKVVLGLVLLAAAPKLWPFYLIFAAISAIALVGNRVLR